MTLFKRCGDALLQMLFPRRCPLCQNLLTDTNAAHLCPGCAKRLSAELKARCPVCRRTAPNCQCTPVLIRSSMTTVGYRQFVTVGFYRTGESQALCNQLIHTVKNSTDDTAARVLARMLSQELLRLFLENGEDIRQWIITYPPRTRKRKDDSGVDQAQRLARFCAKDTGAAYLSLFIRRGGSEQKSLSQTARMENTETSLYLRHPEMCRGHRIILCDDILTSGSTLSRCADLLRSAGATDVFAATVLKTVSKERTKPHLTDMPWFLSE